MSEVGAKVKESKLGHLESTQSTDNRCSVLLYRVYSSVVHISEVMTLSAEGPCPNRRTLSIYVEVAACPHGFELSDTTQSCICHKRLRQYTDHCIINDKSKFGTIFRERKADFWVGFDLSSRGLILHPNCPFDFCTNEETLVTVDNSDVQCNYRNLPKIRPWAMNFSGYSKRGVGLFSSVLVFHSKIGPPYKLVYTHPDITGCEGLHKKRTRK